MGARDIVKGIVEIFRGGALRKRIPAAQRTEPTFQVLTSVGSSGQTIAKDWNANAQVEYYSSWVYVAVSRISQAAAGQALRFYQVGSDGGETELRDHPLNRLMKHVNAVDTYRSLVEATFVSLELTGNAYWILTLGRDGKPIEIIWCPPSKIQAVGGKERPIDSYVVTSDGEEVGYNLSEVMHFRYVDVKQLVYGRSPLQAIAETVEADRCIVQAQKAAFENGILPGMNVKVRETLGEHQVEALEWHLNRKFQGADKAGKIIVTSGGVELAPITRTPMEMDFLTSSDTSRDRILASYGLPKILAGMTEGVPRAAAEAAEYVFAKWNLAPKLCLLEEKITQDLCSRWGKDIIARFDSPIPPADSGESEEARANYSSGAITLNEMREILGYPAVDGGDTFVTGTEGKATELPKFTSRPIDALVLKAAALKGKAKALAEKVFDREASAGKLATVSKPYLSAALETGGRQEERRLRTAGISVKAGPLFEGFTDILAEPGLDKDVLDLADVEKARRTSARIERFLGKYTEAKTFLSAKDRAYWDGTVNETTIDQLDTILASGLEAGDSKDILAERIRKAWRELSPMRAQRIAQTEMVGGINAGHQLVMEANGIASKTWVTQRDERVRASHRAADGQVRKTGSKFRVGSAFLEFPGDPTGPPGETVNCRCTLAAVVEDKPVPVADVEAEAQAAIDSLSTPFEQEMNLYFNGELDSILDELAKQEL